MSLRRLAIVAGAGDPDDALALRIDVVAAAVKVTRAIDKQTRSKQSEQLYLQGEVDLAVSDLHQKTKRYMAACRRRVR